MLDLAKGTFDIKIKHFVATGPMNYAFDLFHEKDSSVCSCVQCVTVACAVHSANCLPACLNTQNSYSKTNQTHQCIKFILFWNDTLHVSDGLSIHHHQFKTVHTAVSL